MKGLSPLPAHSLGTFSGTAFREDERRVWGVLTLRGTHPGPWDPKGKCLPRSPSPPDRADGRPLQFAPGETTREGASALPGHGRGRLTTRGSAEGNLFAVCGALRPQSCVHRVPTVSPSALSQRRTQETPPSISRMEIILSHAGTDSLRMQEEGTTAGMLLGDPPLPGFPLSLGTPGHGHGPGCALQPSLVLLAPPSCARAGVLGSGAATTETQHTPSVHFDVCPGAPWLHFFVHLATSVL